MFKLFLPFTFILALLTTASVTAQQWGNYHLYSTQNSTAAYLLDTNNNVVHTWTFPSTAKTGYSTYLEPGGTLLRTVARTGNSFSGGPICGQVQRVDWNGNVLWDYVYSTTNYCTHHDICPMPNGNVLLIAYERKTATEVSAAGCSTAIEMWPDKIVEVQPVGTNGGNIVWEWHAWDHLVQNVDATKPNYQSSIVNHPELLNINFNTQKDWMHMNGVDYNPILNQVVFSCHNLNEIYVIDHSTTTAEAATHSGGNSGKGGDILYRWGCPNVYGASGSQILNVTHDAHWIPEGIPNSGYLVAYNNRGISNSASCVDIINPPYNGYNYSITPGSAFAPSSYTYRQASGGFNSNMGNSQQLPNGNMIVTIATAGVMKEFDSAGNLLWSKTANGAVPKSFRYDSCYVFNQPPAIPTITQSNDTLYASLATTYQWYYNGQLIQGANNPYYVANQQGNYIVRITDANGCIFQYSPEYKYSGVTSVPNIFSNVNFNIIPNPSTGLIKLNGLEKLSGVSIKVYDPSGNLIRHFSNEMVLNLSDLSNGVYHISVIADHQEISNKKLVILK